MGLFSRSKRWFLVLATVLGIPMFSQIAGAGIQADAAVAQHVVANRSVCLRGTPRIANNVIRRETVGSTMTVVSGSTPSWWHVRDSHGRVGYVIRKGNWVGITNRAQTQSGMLPPGVRIDRSIHAKAPLQDSTQRKTAAVLSVAKSKLGTPYRWGHNEDRGQYGFDCSNFTAYVYHHALGYRISGASKAQAHSVGWTVSRQSMRPGDLLIFEHGKHVGIYVGNGKMIEEGGGLGRVGYLSVRRGSYWGNHLTAVKRMYR